MGHVTLEQLGNFRDIGMYLCDGYCEASTDDGATLVIYIPVLKHAATDTPSGQTVQVGDEKFDVFSMEDLDGDVITVVTNGVYTTGLLESSLSGVESAPFVKASPSDVMSRINLDLGRGGMHTQ